MAFLAVAYPKLDESDFDWVQSIRKKHDQQFDLVRPHITLVFGTDKLRSNDFIAHVQSKVRTVQSFQITFDSAKVVEDHSGNFCNAFLVPSKGYSEIIELHDLLYQDDLSSELRTDIPFIPHMTIGSGNEEEMTTLVDEINESKISIEASVDQISIISFDGVKVTDIDRQDLT